jgi:broad specificity phosphatase PhoE
MAILDSFKHTYIVCRHGESLAQKQGYILSDIGRDGVVQGGLTPLGKKQIEKSTRELAKSFMEREVSNVLLINSPFRRAYESREVAERVFFEHGITPGWVNKAGWAFRERFFGDLENKPISLYEDVWHKDDEDTGHQTFCVESVDAVLGRMLGAIKQLEEEYNTPQVCIMYSHGDPLNILSAYTKGLPVGAHWGYASPLQNAEYRQLNHNED